MTDHGSWGESYRPSGRVKWVRLVFLAVPTSAVGVGLAFCLSAAYERGWYRSPFVALGAALLMTLMAYLTVLFGHCRNRKVACVYAVLSGLLVYVGHFYVNFYSHAGPQAARRIDLLFEHTVGRANEDWGWLQERLAVNFTDGKNDAASRAAINWFVFAVDGLILAGLPAFVAVVKAGRVYCENCRCWLCTQKVYGSSEHGYLVAEALGSAAFDDLPAIPTVADPKDTEFAIFRLEYCAPDEPRIACGRAHLTVKDVRLGLLVRTLVDKVAIGEEELAALARKLTAFSPVATLVGGGPAAEPRAGARRAGESPLAFVEPAPHPWGAHVLTRSDDVVKFVLTNVPGAGIVAGIAMIAAGLWRKPWNAGPGGWVTPESFVWLGGGALLALASVLISWLNDSILGRRFSRWIARGRIFWHLDSPVDPDDPAALYVEIVPRKHWTQLDHDRPSEVGFLVVDSQRGELRFEGSQWRYRIPGAAIISCRVEPIEAAPGWAIAHATVVCARASREGSPDGATDGTPTGSLDLPFVQRPMTLVTSAKIRQATAEKLRRQVRGIMPPEDPGQLE